MAPSSSAKALFASLTPWSQYPEPRQVGFASSPTCEPPASSLWATVMRITPSPLHVGHFMAARPCPRPFSTNGLPPISGTHTWDTLPLGNTPGSLDSAKQVGSLAHGIQHN